MSRTTTDLRVRDVVGDAWSIYRRHFAIVAGSAIPLFAVIGILGIVVHVLEEELAPDIRTAEAVAILALVLVSSLARSLGGVVYAGFLDESVGAELDGRPLPTVSEVMRRLPYARLLAGDLIVTFVVAAGSALFLLPGLVAFTLLGIVGPLINIEGHGVVPAIRRSMHLVSRRFWTAFVLLAPLLVIEHATETAFVLSVDGTPLLASIGFGVVLGLSVGAALGLVEVVLAHRLMRADREASGDAAG